MHGNAVPDRIVRLHIVCHFGKFVRCHIACHGNQVIMHDLSILQRQQLFNGIAQTQSRCDQHGTACNAADGHNKPLLIAEQIAQRDLV